MLQHMPSYGGGWKDDDTQQLALTSRNLSSSSGFGPGVTDAPTAVLATDPARDPNLRHLVVLNPPRHTRLPQALISNICVLSTRL